MGEGCGWSGVGLGWVGGVGWVGGWCGDGGGEGVGWGAGGGMVGARLAPLLRLSSINPKLGNGILKPLVQITGPDEPLMLLLR